MALNLCGKTVDQELKDLRVTAEGIRAYTDNWETHLKTLDEQIGQVERLAIVGRGPSYATAMESALAMKEGPKINAEGLATGQFWHGPVELADEHYTVFALAGEPVSRKEDEFLAKRAAGLGAKVFWFCEHPAEGLPQVELPQYAGIGLTMAEILPVQLIAINIGKQSGFRPGDFRYLTTVVSTKQEVFPG
jgi:glucosamine--fructose-6-phosphate aminotransferase (isomerizing)